MRVQYRVILAAVISISGVFCFHPLSCAGVIGGKDAASYMGEFKDKIAGRSYGAIILRRRNVEPMTGDMIDAVLFIPAEYKYRYIRRLDEDYVLKLGSQQKKEADVVREDNVSAYEKIIEDNRLKPFVILDENNGELALVYCGIQDCDITFYKNKKDEIIVHVKNAFPRENISIPFLDFDTGVSQE